MHRGEPVGLAPVGGEREALQWLSEKKGLDEDLPVRKLGIKRDVEDWFEKLGRK